MVSPVRPNILLVTLDQFRGDCLSCAGHPVVQTPHLDDLCANGVRLSRHYSQASPCAPGRAAIYTGTYQMNNRVVANGTPLDDRFDNIARAARRAGYEPALFGYTDQSIDPRLTDGPDDPRLSTYEGVLPGFDCIVDLSGAHEPWTKWLAERGHDVSRGHLGLLGSEHERPASESVSAFLAGEVIDWIGAQSGPWFAHVSFLRPHPPYSAAGDWSRRYDPAEVGDPIAPTDDPHPFHALMMSLDECNVPDDPAAVARMRAQYFGMVSEVDDNLGRIWRYLRDTGAWNDTVIVVTSDHGEQLGDHGLREKVGYWEQSHHVVGIVRDPRYPEAHGSVVDDFTENVDLMPTLCEAMGVDVPAQCDGMPLTEFMNGVRPSSWRDAAHWEYDWRFSWIGSGRYQWPRQRRPERSSLAVRRSRSHAYVQFGDGDWLCFDLVADPTWRTKVDDPVVVAEQARAMLAWRMEHAARDHTGFLARDGGTGRWPDGVPWRATAD